MKSFCNIKRTGKCLFAALIFITALNAQANTFRTERWQTANGTRVVFYKAMEVPMLDISIAFSAGSAHDGKLFGLSTLTTSLMNQGSQTMDANQIAEKLADAGAQFSGESSRDMAVLSLKTLTKADAMKQAIDTFTAIVNRPDFPQDAFKREKNQQLLAIAQTLESPEDVANQILFKKLYLNHPYAHPINGMQETVNKITVNNVRDYYKQYFVASNAVLVMVGAIESQQAHQLADQITKGLAKGQPATLVPEAAPLKQGERIAVEFPSSQTILRLGQIGINHHSPEYFPLTVGNYILGGGALVSILSHEVREKRGLTYGITSQFMPMPGNGPFVISLSTKNKSAETALQVTEDTLRAYLDKGPTENELNAAKQYLTGSFGLSLASNASIASMLLRISFYNLPPDYLDNYVTRINKVTTTEIKQAFQKQIHPENMIIIAVGKK